MVSTLKSAVTPNPLAFPLAWDLVAPGYAEESFEHFERYAKDALALAELTPQSVVLDVAAGPGSLALLASERASRVHAIDFSESMLAELEKRKAARAIDNVVSGQGDGQALPFADATFDAAFSMFGLMFFPDRAQGFKELRRVLKPGGRAVVASWQPMDRVPLLVAVFAALHEQLPALPFGDGKGPLSDPHEFEAELSEPGFRVQIRESVHHLEAESMETFWAACRRSFAPLVLLEHKMGNGPFEPIAEGIRRRLLERFGNGPVSAAMPAWLGVGYAV